MSDQPTVPPDHSFDGPGGPGSVDEVAVQERRRRFSIVWIIPIVVVLVGGWLAYTTIAEKGPTVTISFKTAEGLESGKTKVKFKDVEVGLVESVTIKPDLSGVTITAGLSKEVENHLTTETRFWVVRPRLGAGGVSGLGTLLSGAYVELDPGETGAPAKTFVGLELPPLVRAETQGKTFDLEAEKLGSFSYGSPIYYRGFKAGQVLGFELAEDNRTVAVHIFVNEPYDALVHEHTRFWNVSGVHVTLDANGMDLRTESLETLLQGGIAFDTPQTLESGQPAEEGTVFALYSDKEAVAEASYVQRERTIMYFDGSVRGLSVDAPVEFRGIRVGTVVDIKMEFDREAMAFRIPVLIEFEPGRISVIGERFNDPRQAMEALIKMGMRAQLQTGNLLTGQLFVALDLHPDTPIKLVGADSRYPEMPTIPTTIEAITASVTGVLDRVAALPMEELFEDLRETADSTNKLVSSPDTREALHNLNATLARAETLMQTLDTEVGPLVASLRSTSDAAGLAMAQAQATLSNAENMTGEKSQLRHDLNSLFEELTRAARSFRVLADYLETHPDALIRGKGGANNQ
jgi:paraquat-inducible protein B